jgi:hypothetical protein
MHISLGYRSFRISGFYHHSHLVLSWGVQWLVCYMADGFARTQRAKPRFFGAIDRGHEWQAVCRWIVRSHLNILRQSVATVIKIINKFTERSKYLQTSNIFGARGQLYRQRFRLVKFQLEILTAITIQRREDGYDGFTEDGAVFAVMSFTSTLFHLSP